MRYQGLYTVVDLRQLGWFPLLNGREPDRGAARFGLELARLAYDFEFAPWLAAGWTDISIVVDSRLISGVHQAAEQADLVQQARNLLLPRLAQGLKRVSNPLRDAARYLKQSPQVQTGSAVILLRQDAAGQYTIAIAFMGTGRRLQDWLGNLRFGRDGYFYQGFSDACSHFEAFAGDIRFPTLARTLGLESLSLRDALDLARQPDSGLRFVLAGHSRGAALMQIWAYRRLLEGVQASQIAGLGYGSPGVSEGFPPGIANYPIHHFLAADDVFIRVGLREHLGTCFLLPSDAAFRAACYAETGESPLFNELLGLVGKVEDTPGGLLFILAFLEALSARSAAGIASALAILMDIGLGEIPALAEEGAGKLLDAAKRRFRLHYREAASSLPNIVELEGIRKAIDALMEAHGAAAVSAMLLKTLHLPHRLVGPGRESADFGAYSYLTVRGFSQLQPLPERIEGAADAPPASP